MRSYFIDELSRSHVEKIAQFLEQNALSSRMEHIHWVELPKDLLSPAQHEHRACAPHVFAVELGTDWLKAELFVRSLGTMSCACPAYCSGPQREFVIRFVDTMIEELGLTT